MYAKLLNALRRLEVDPSFVSLVTSSAVVSIVGAGFAFLVGIQLARILGSEAYGQYGLVMSIIAIISVPTRIGLPQLLTRELASYQVQNNWGLIRGIQGWATKINLALSAVVILLIVLWLKVAAHELSRPVQLTLLAGLVLIPLMGQTSLREASLRGLQHIVRAQLPDVLIRPAFFSLLLFLWSLTTLEPSPVVAMGMAAASVAVAWIGAGVMLSRVTPAQMYSVKSTYQVKSWWPSALPMALSECMRVVQGHLVILLLGLMSTVIAVGLYRVASSVSTMLTLPVTLLMAGGAPMISRLHAQGERRQLQRLLRWLSLAMVLFTLVLVAPFLVFGSELLSAIFGPDFGTANQPLMILGCGMVGNACFGASPALLNMTGHERRVTRASTLALVFLLLSSPPLIYVFDIIGAALAYVFSMLLWRGLMWFDGLVLLDLDSSILALSGNKSRPESPREANQ